ncbi:uncharacterized protein BX664DRAFT_300840 [Halteromyces radiatus]|uniref:uncharacterized protein n=1 Tax=Halteromyces radiatus TaxID=101107 RepID=UPI0022203286|nr:uncharacterized protein BX664DRAFT_300840 [Halteromyces radiatus]KAI8085115.1 hypothetical protein BX664DRAFT_300840 [Halteromyces radiatus]
MSATTETISTITEKPVSISEKQNGEEEYQDRYLEGSHQFVAYDLLEARGKSGETDDPDVKRYQEAKTLFRKGYDLCMTIPRSLEDAVLEKYQEDIKTSAETMVDAWLLDDKAAPMSERVLILGQQYEKVLLKDIPEEQKEGFFVKYSLLFSAWILLVGKQFDHCITTLSLAVDTYDDLTARVFFLRASCYFSTNQLELGIKDLEKSLELDSNFNLAYSILGSVYMSVKNNELALKNFEQYLERGHPDTPDNINALYSMSLLLQKPKSDNKEAKEYYQKAKKAEARFKDLYGTHVGMNEIKREAIQAHETPDEARRLILASLPKKQYNEKIEQLIKAGILNTSFPPSPKNCSHCGTAHLKDTPGKPLLCCAGCKSIWYCSRDCQKLDYKNHKVNCKKQQQKQIQQ